MKIRFIGMQFILYSFVGALTCVIDFAFFILLTRGIDISLLSSFVIAFVLATLANYLLCLKFIFTSNESGAYQQILRTFFVSGVGLVISTIIFASLNHYTTISPIWNKLFIIPVVTIWNFWARRTLVFSAGMPDATINAINKLFRDR